jgi:hypothetical protein
MTLYYNPQTKVIFASDDSQDSPTYEITDSQVADLQADGASVDSSAADKLGKSDSTASQSTDAAPAAQAPVASATSSGMADEPQSPNVSADASATGSQTAQPAPVASSDTQASSVSQGPSTDSVPVTAPANVSTQTEIIPVESVKTTNDVADPAASIAAGPGVSSDPAAPVKQDATTAAEGADALPPPKDLAEEQAQAAEGVDTTKDTSTVIIHGPVGSISGEAVTPSGKPVVDAQPDAVTVKGPEVPAGTAAAVGVGTTADLPDSVAQSNPYHGLSHEDAIDRLLTVMEGIAAMGKAEIQAEMMLMAGMFRRNK